MSAKDKGTGKENKITIKANSGLSEDEIQRMVDEAAQFEEMMALLESDMVRLQEALVVHDAAVPELREWLTQLESRYAMAEQREDHLDAKGDLSKPDSNETTFF